MNIFFFLDSMPPTQFLTNGWSNNLILIYDVSHKNSAQFTINVMRVLLHNLELKFAIKIPD